MFYKSNNKKIKITDQFTSININFLIKLKVFNQKNEVL